MSNAHSSAKRSMPAEDSDDGFEVVEVKKTKLAPIFANASQNGVAARESLSRPSTSTLPSSSAGPSAQRFSSSAASLPTKSAFALPATLPSKIRWETQGAKSTCLVGCYGEPAADAIKRLAADTSGKPRVAVAMFDLDWTLVKPKGGRRWPDSKDPYDYDFMFSNTVKKVQESYEKGRIIAIVSNQFQSGKVAQPADTPKMKTWKSKLLNICTALRVPCYIFSALAKDNFRKPHPGMWDAFIHIWTKELGRSKIEIALAGRDSCLDVSFYVGDFAGRQADGRTPKDHKDTDRKFAINTGLKFFTPEEFFSGATRNNNFKLEGFNARAFLSQMQDVSQPEPTFLPDGALEVILFVGPPGSGKTSYYERHFKPREYAWVNQDTLRSRDKCMQAAQKHLNNGRSCVVDNTNRDRQTRAYYVALAQEHNARVRCFDFTMDVAQAWHQNLYRAFSPNNKTQIIPVMGLTTFKKDYQPPTRAEGFAEDPVKIPFVFQGTSAERERYALWYATMDDF